MTRLTRTLAFFACVLALFLGSVREVAAQKFWDSWLINTNTSTAVEKTMQAVVNSDNSGVASRESNIDGTVGDLTSTLFLTLAGPPESALSSLNEEERRIVQQRYGQGLIGDVGRATTAMYHPPASIRTYVADLLESTQIIPQAQAQGLGFSALDPILETWKVFRNVAYLFFTVVLLVIGFMIMFRQKIGGQTVVTAQQAIPGIIVALIVVTFSYAIAGFLIDLMYLLMYLLIGIFNPPGGTGQMNMSFLEFGRKLITGEGGTGGVLGDGALASMNNSIQTLTNSMVGGGLPGAIVGIIGGLTLSLILAIAIFIGMFKVFIELLKSYISIIISVATAPLLLMLGAIPGKNNFVAWLKTMGGNLMAFPTVLFSLILYDMFTQHDLSVGGFMPPYLVGQGVGGPLITLVGIGIILIIPELIKEIKKAFGADGGVWENLVGAMGKQMQEGAPLGLKTAGGIMGALPGFTLGAIQGIRETRGQRAGRGLEILGYAARGMAGGVSRGTGAGGAVSTAFGGKTPGTLQGVEGAVDFAANFFTEDQILERMAQQAQRDEEMLSSVAQRGHVSRWRARADAARGRGRRTHQDSSPT